MSEEKIFCGSGKKVNDWKTGLIVCLDDIPEEHIFVDKHDKRCVRLNLCEKRNKEEGKNTHYLEVNTWRPENKHPQQPQQPESKEPAYRQQECPF